MQFGGLVIGLEQVLCSTAHLHRQAWEVVLNNLGIPCRCINKVDFSSLCSEEEADILLQCDNLQLSKIERDMVIMEKNELYRNLLFTLTPEDLFPCVLPLLDEIKALKFPIGIASNNKSTVLILKYLGLSDYFNAVSDGNADETDANEAGRIYYKACEYMNLSPKNCLVWEGTPQKANEAKAAGFCVITGKAQEVRTKFLFDILEKK